MVQRVTVTSETAEDLKFLIKAAIRSELRMLEHGIRRTRERLAQFEAQFGMTSAEFERRFDGQDLKETLDFLDWWMEVEALRRLEGKYQALRDVHIG
ncbi:MAG: hypothetical protein ACRDH2_09590 [Anaerolineales bacterium]